MKSTLMFILFSLSLVCYSQKNDCELAGAIMETISLYDSIKHGGVGYPGDEKSYLNFQVFLMKDNLKGNQIDKKKMFDFEFDNEFSRDSATFIISVAKKHSFKKDIIPNCFFDLKKSKILFYDYKNPIQPKKINKKQIMSISSHFVAYSDAYPVWFVSVDGESINIKELFGHYSPYE